MVGLLTNMIAIKLLFEPVGNNNAGAATNNNNAGAATNNGIIMLVLLLVLVRLFNYSLCSINLHYYY